MLRGGAFKPRTSPYAFQGLGEVALEYLKEGARADRAAAFVTELMDPAPCRGDPRRRRRDSRSALAICRTSRYLSEVGSRADPGTAEARPFVDRRGSSDGRRVHREGGQLAGDPLRARDQRRSRTSTRFTLDIGAIPVLKMETHLPVIVDPSHPAGRRELVLSARPRRRRSGCRRDHRRSASAPPKRRSVDAAQQIPTADFPEFAAEIRRARVPYGTHDRLAGA